MKKRIWTTALWIGLSSSVMYAQENAPSPTVNELMSVMRMQDSMSSGFDAMLPMIDALSDQWQLTPEQEHTLKGIYRDWFKNDFDQESLINKISLEYGKVFTEAEMQKMIAFYETPTGQKVLDSLPHLTQLGAQLGMQEGQKKQHLLEEKIRVFYEENVESQP